MTDIVTDLRNYRSGGTKGAKLTVCERAADHIEGMKEIDRRAAIIINSLMNELGISAHIVTVGNETFGTGSVMKALKGE